MGVVVPAGVVLSKESSGTGRDVTGVVRDGAGICDGGAVSRWPVHPDTKMTAAQRTRRISPKEVFICYQMRVSILNHFFLPGMPGDKRSLAGRTQVQGPVRSGKPVLRALRQKVGVKSREFPLIKRCM